MQNIIRLLIGKVLKNCIFAAEKLKLLNNNFFYTKLMNQ